MSAADSISAALEKHIEGRLVAKRVQAARRVDPVPQRHVAELTTLNGGTLRLICMVTDDGGRIVVDIDEGQMWVIRACGFSDDEERGCDWALGECVRSWRRSVGR